MDNQNPEYIRGVKTAAECARHYNRCTSHKYDLGDCILLKLNIIRPENVRPNDPPQTGADLIATERKRQIEKEGWTAEHDSEHSEGDLTEAAICYADVSVKQSEFGGERRHYKRVVPTNWPWDIEWWKPSMNRVRNLVKAGALIAAEIDKILKESK